MRSIATRLPAALSWLFASWRFPVFVLFVLAFYEVLLGAILLVPTAGPFGEFAADFKRWCFGYDPATGGLEPMSVIAMVVEPVALGATLMLLWWKPLGEVLRTPRVLWSWGAGAAGCVTVGALLLGTLSGERAVAGELPFPAERLRTAHPAPKFLLHDQDGAAVSLEALRGRVVVVTAVYATCGFTCPMILSQAKAAIATLSEAEQRDVTVVGVTLDPEHDDRGRLSAMAAGQGVAAPHFRLVTGEPGAVNAVLDEMGVARKRNAETGVIDHANLFLVLDRGGRVAYRFSLGERQEAWLGAALRLLVRERPGEG